MACAGEVSHLDRWQAALKAPFAREGEAGMAGTTETIDEAVGSAGTQGELWGERARDWADVLEGWNGWGLDAYRQVLERVAVGRGTKLLDMGCGAGRFSRIAADRGAQVAGIDATAAFIEIARERVRGGDFRVGDLEQLPWGDDSFDVVTGFNSFIFAAHIDRALREARRVARPGASVAITAFGRPDRCESTHIFGSVGQLLPAQSEDRGPALHEEGTLEFLATEAGLAPKEAGYFEVTEEYPDLDTFLRGYLAAGPLVGAGRELGDQAVRDALAEGVRPLITVAGGVRIEDELCYLIASA
jgi:ubiquinone/menaquinone biosynthesis C-methylase UbiE